MVCAASVAGGTVAPGDGCDGDEGVGSAAGSGNEGVGSAAGSGGSALRRSESLRPL